MLQAQEMQEVNARLMARAQSVEDKHNQMMQHVTQMNECLKQKTLENERLQTELNLLKRSMKVSPFSEIVRRLPRRACCVLKTSCDHRTGNRSVNADGLKPHSRYPWAVTGTWRILFCLGTLT